MLGIASITIVLMHKILLLPLILLLYTCSDEDTVNNSRYSFEKISELKVPLSVEIPPTTTSSKAYQMNGGEFIFLVNKRTNSLVQISTENTADIQYHQFEQEGPNGVGLIRGVAKFDDHTLILVSERPTHYFYDLTEKTITTSELTEFGSGELLTQANFTSNDYEEYCKIGSKGYFQQSSMTWSTSLGRDNPEYKLLAYYDEQSREYHLADFKFPSDYNTTTEYMNRPSTATDGSSIYLSLFSDHRIHVYNEKKQYSKLAKSKHLPEKFASISINDQGQNTMEYLAIQPCYLGLIYDKYRDIFYRIAKVTKEQDINVLKKNSQFYAFRPMQFSILVLDNQLNLLSETLLPPDKYLHMNCFVLKEGLAISKMHPANSELSEDHLEFDVFEHKLIF